MTNVLIVMRYADMHRVHPQQDNTRVCAQCKERVGVYPSGQAALAEDPTMQIVCSVCAEGERLPSIGVPAPGALDEPRQSIDNPLSPEERERATQEFVHEMQKKGWNVKRGGDRQ